MTERPRYYQPLEVPDYCFIWEAVMWVTFGRFPEGNGLDADELKDELGLLSFAWQDSFGGPRYRFRGYWWHETEMAGVDLQEVDWERYDAALRSGYQRLDALRRSLVELERATHGEEPAPVLHFPDRDKLYREMCERELAEAPFVESVHKLYQQPVDRGWSCIFRSLVDGTLQGYGWADLTQAEIRERAAKGDLMDYDGSHDEGNVINPWHAKLPEPDTIGPLQPMGMCMEIPQNEWSLSGIAPDGRYVTSAGRNWWDVCFSCDQLFEQFPRPILASDGIERDTIEILNPGLAVGAVSNPGPHAPKQVKPSGRGRKKLADGEIERACQSLFGQRWAAGEKEAPLHAEAEAFAIQVWGRSLARSTFQAYMKPFKRAPKNSPEMMPEFAAE